jgi:hypothetical protein
VSFEKASGLQKVEVLQAPPSISNVSFAPKMPLKIKGYPAVRFS